MTISDVTHNSFNHSMALCDLDMEDTSVDHRKKTSEGVSAASAKTVVWGEAIDAENLNDVGWLFSHSRVQPTSSSSGGPSADAGRPTDGTSVLGKRYYEEPCGIGSGGVSKRGPGEACVYDLTDE